MHAFFGTGHRLEQLYVSGTMYVHVLIAVKWVILSLDTVIQHLIKLYNTMILWLANISETALIFVHKNVASMQQIKL